MGKVSKQKDNDFFKRIKWYLNTGISGSQKRDVLNALNKESAASAVLACYFFAFLFGTYSLSVTPYLQQSFPELTLWQNTYPRLILSVIPCLLLAVFLKKSSISNHMKCVVFYGAFSIIYLVTANIYIWPAALVHDDGQILALMAGPNALTYVIVCAALAPSIGILLTGSSLFIVIFWLPYFVLTKSNSSSVLFTFVSGAIIMTLPIGIAIASKLAIQRARNIERHQSVEKKAKESVNSATATALFDPLFDFGAVRERKGLYSVFDLRGSTRLKQQANGQRLIREFMETGMAIALQNGAEIVNDRGDGFFLFFGPQENKDIVNLDGFEFESELRYADTRLYAKHFENVRRFHEEMATAMDQIEKKYGIGSVRAGFATTLATAKYFFLQAHDHKREHWDHDVLSLLDRLEKLSKSIGQEEDLLGSIAVFHPNTRIFRKNSIVLNRKACRGLLDGHENVVEVDYEVFSGPKSGMKTAG